ncbi:DUF559 domain-containing protein [Polymorphobacter fuscus]|uniref:DUF559 domain-containing protein n=1 Tax=Sandarakinorhabdus fusca TaxID=1439888 RepID=A0A7C9GTT2_9SPHN|nr:endonuclease domain-containing protein [Polymorphobacter fuscus]MQT16329.1 DUF559 domain-containing protein [Polymorphobacter fuscus]
MAAEQLTKARQLRSNATPAERKLWQALRASQLNGHKFSRQIAVGPYIADLVCRKQRLVIELDGSQHGGAADLARQHYIEAHGYRVLRFWNWQAVDHTEMVVAIIAEALAPEAPTEAPTPDPSRKREGRP